MSKKFTRRRYNSPAALWRDLRQAFRLRPALRNVRAEIPPVFRERLMLAVTAVNECRYCSYFHAGQALKAGVPEQEMRSLLAGDLPADVPAEEIAGLLYAQHWAERSGQPDPEARRGLVQAYGETKAQAIEALLLMIQIGNLSGNSGDYLLYRLSFGRWGDPPARQGRPDLPLTSPE